MVMNSMMAVSAFVAAVTVSLPLQATNAHEARKVLNIVNFVRSADPRPPRADMIRAVREEVALNLKYGFKNTILLQYDALVDPEMMAEALKSDKSKTEFGLWFEMSRPLNEAAGLPWKPKGAHKNWDWDWHINPGFLMAYDHAGRKAIIDAAFKRFKADFGYYPKSVGSWLLDAWSMDYMEKTYGVDGFCICREQDNTDAYGLRGGYSNGAYYPSKKNMLSAAVDMANAVKSPVFKMLTPDPIYNYGRPYNIYRGFPHNNPPTMEPAMSGGYKPENVDWYFRVYTEPKGLMNLSYMQAGQENSFWREDREGSGSGAHCRGKDVRDGALVQGRAQGELPSDADRARGLVRIRPQERVVQQPLLPRQPHHGWQAPRLPRHPQDVRRLRGTVPRQGLHGMAGALLHAAGR